MPLKNISKATWDEVKAEERALRIRFGKVLLKENQEGKSLRVIGGERGISHVQVRILIETAREELEQQVA